MTAILNMPAGVIDYFDRGCASDPAADCLIDARSGQRLSYAETRDESLALANALRARGFGPGRKVAVWGGNEIATVVLILGVIRAGAAWLPVNIRNTDASIAENLSSFDCDLLFIHQRHLGALELIRAAAPGLRQVVVFGGMGQVGAVAPAGTDALPAWTGHRDLTPVVLTADPEQLYSLTPSTGTSGQPKGILTPVRTAVTMTENLLATGLCGPKPRFLAVSPMSHASGGFMHFIFAQAGAIVLFAGGGAPAILQAVAAFGITHSFMAPTVIYDLLADPGLEAACLDSLQCIFYGGAAMAPAKIREAITRLGPRFAQVYGQVEIGGSAAVLMPEDHLQDGRPADDARLASSGRAMRHAEVAIMANDDSGRLLPAGESGEIVLRGSGVMQGYYRDPEATAQISLHGWHHTQDIGWLDDQGYLYVIDRKRDMIISGGFNIFSVEVENAALSHPAVQECAAIGLPHPRWGEAVTLLVRLRPGMAADAAEISAHCRAGLGATKAPKAIEFVTELPRNSAGKILKAQLRREYLSRSAPPGAS